MFVRAIFSAIAGVAIAFDAIRADKVRAALTMFGVAVGVSVVVIISAAMHGINDSVAKDLAAAGSTTFRVMRFPPNASIVQTCGDKGCNGLNNPAITIAEANAIGHLPSIFAAAAEIDDQPAVTYRTETLPGPQVQGQTPNWIEVTGGDISPGRSFTALENSSAERVLVVNDEMAKALFGARDPIGKTVMIRGNQFRVIGVYHSMSVTQSKTPMAIAPFETVRRRLQGDPGGLMVTVKPRAAVAHNQAIDEVTVQLRILRGLKPGADNTFGIVTQDQLYEASTKMFGTFFLVMIVLSAIGLVVGGVGVVAIMMISVTERTREIGIRKALGATGGMILWQFLAEAVTLTGIGSALGLALGWIVTLVVRAVTPVSPSIPPLSILAALAASAVTGVLFGIYPALQAARLDPIDALRYE